MLTKLKLLEFLKTYPDDMVIKTEKGEDIIHIINNSNNEIIISPSKPKGECLSCGDYVYKEEVIKNYPYFCPTCDENNFKFEVKFFEENKPNSINFITLDKHLNYNKFGITEKTLEQIPYYNFDKKCISLGWCHVFNFDLVILYHEESKTFYKTPKFSEISIKERKRNYVDENNSTQQGDEFRLIIKGEVSKSIDYTSKEEALDMYNYFTNLRDVVNKQPQFYYGS